MAINLQKGQKISLKKEDGTALKSFCVGANWGIIEGKGFFGGAKKISVDLDLSVGIFNKKNQLINTIYFRNLLVQGIKHSGDDLVGDIYGDDGLDNEVISIDLSNVQSNVEQIVFVLNSYKKQDFATIPFASIRLYEGTPTQVKRVFASYNIASDAKFSGYVSMILGKLYKRNGEWRFSAIGEPSKKSDLRATLKVVEEKFL